MNLKQIEIFSDLTDKTLKNISKIVKEKNVKKDTVIFEELTAADVFCLIAEGKVEVFKHLSGNDKKVLAILSTGDYFGEMSLFENKPRMASVKAIEDTTLLEIKKKDFNSLLSSDLNSGMKLLSAIMSTTLNRLSTTDSHLTLLYDIGKIIASSRNLKQMTMDTFSKITKHFKKHNRGLIAIYNEFTDELDVHSSINIQPPIDILLKTDPFVNKISSEKEIILNSEEDYKNGFFSGKSIIVSAFYFEEKFLGFILFAGDQNNSFNINDLILLSSVASLISVSIKNISFISEEEARKRLEETRYKQSF